jgi:23S rRNA (guanosine2251-2'-O)-methyltransferase
MKERWIYGFHAIRARLRSAPGSVKEVWVDESRQDARMRDLLALMNGAGLAIRAADGGRLDKMVGGARHQGVVAKVEPIAMARTLDDVMESIQGAPLIVVLDGVTDPHNLGAVLRSADAFGAHAVIAPKDRSAGLTDVAVKTACGAAESVPYITVTNLARTLRELKERDIWIVGTAGEAEQDIYTADWPQAVALVMGAEGEGMRRLTRENCDQLVRIPMHGSVESLNVSVAAGVCLFEARRRRG